MKKYFVELVKASAMITGISFAAPMILSVFALPRSNGYMLMVLVMAFALVMFSILMLPCVRFFAMIRKQERLGYPFEGGTPQLLSKEMTGTYGEGLWDMQGNLALRGVMVSESKKMIYNLESLTDAPSLEEVILLSSMDRKYTTRTLAPLQQCRYLRRAMVELNTENKDFRPEYFSHLDTFQYQVDRKRNF